MGRRLLMVLVVVVWAVLPAVAAQGPPGAEASLQEMLAQNVALGDNAGANAPNAATAERVEDLAQRGTKLARTLVSTKPKSAEAHDLLGLFLTVAYRVAPEGKGALRRAGAEPATAKEGLQELALARKLNPKEPEYALDYAWALIAANQRPQALNELRALPQRFPKLLPPTEARRQQLQLLALGRRAAAEAEPAPAEAKVPEKISWVSYDEAFVQAKEQHKLVLVDFKAEWCGWCRKMDEEVYPKPEVVALSKSVVFVQVNTDQNPPLKDRYHVVGLPTVVILEADGKERGRIRGYKPVDQFVRAVKAVVSNTSSR